MDKKLVMYSIRRIIGLGLIIGAAACGYTGIAMIAGLIYFVHTIQAIKKYLGQ